MSNNEITKNDYTKNIYIKKTFELSKKCRKNLNIYEHEELDIRQFVAWLILNKTKYNKNTWRLYKSSVIFFLETEIEKGNFIAQEAYDTLKEEYSYECNKKSKKTSGKKVKKFPQSDYLKIMDYLDKEKESWATNLKNWIISGILIGLRPIEWANAQYINESTGDKIIVKNAKNTNGRSLGEFRTILLTNLNDKEKNILKTHIKICNEWELHNQFNYYYNSCSNKLRKICKLLWKRKENNISLYSARHQFSANAKASGFSCIEIAALMGHAVDITATKHYARKQSGYDLIKVTPSPEDVLKVKNTINKQYDYNIQVKNTSKK